MRITDICQDHATVLLQIARECPEFKEQVGHLPQDWLTLATIVGRLEPDRHTERKSRAN